MCVRQIVVVVFYIVLCLLLGLLGKKRIKMVLELWFGQQHIGFDALSHSYNQSYRSINMYTYRIVTTYRTYPLSAMELNA
jgi:hypothetical protein